MKKTSYFIVVCMLTLFLAGCGKSTPKEFSQTNGGLTASLSIAPYPPVVMEPATLRLTLTDAAGQMIDGARIAYDLTMPGMAMPPNQPQASGQGDGRYHADAIFTMSGKWRVQATVTHNGKEAVFTFDFSVK